MALKISAPSPSFQSVDSNGFLYPEFASWTQVITERSLIIGSGNPEGVVEAPQGGEYMDEDAAVGDCRYIKRLSDIGGDKTLGWRPY